MSVTEKKSVTFFSDLFETSFIMPEPVRPEGGGVNRAAISPFGFELVETSPPAEKTGLANIVLKVPNLDTASGELATRGYKPEAKISVRKLKELIYTIRGITIVLAEYEGSNFGLK